MVNILSEDDDLLGLDDEDEWFDGGKGGHKDSAVPAKFLPVGFCLEYIEQATKIGLMGATSEQMADFFDVEVVVFDKWRATIPEFEKAVREGKDMADANVAYSMYRRACGYSHKEQKVSNYLGEPIVTEVTKHYPPDTPAAIFWLMARQRSKWGKDANPLEKGKGFMKIYYPEDYESKDVKLDSDTEELEDF